METNIDSKAYQKTDQENMHFNANDDEFIVGEEIEQMELKDLRGQGVLRGRVSSGETTWKSWLWLVLFCLFVVMALLGLVAVTVGLASRGKN